MADIADISKTFYYNHMHLADTEIPVKPFVTSIHT